MFAERWGENEDQLLYLSIQDKEVDFLFKVLV